MKFAAWSDLHGKVPRSEFRKDLEGVDVLLLAGDVFESTIPATPLLSFFDKARNDFGVRRIVMTPGNHDLDIAAQWFRDHRDDICDYNEWQFRRPFCNPDIMGRLESAGVDVLIDRTIDIDGIKIHGSPWSPTFCGWAFMDKDRNLAGRYDGIGNVDIWISHSPPRIYGSEIDIITDPGSDYGKQCGSVSLADAIGQVQPRYFLCGHIHSGDHNLLEVGRTKCYNVSHVDEMYRGRYPVLKFDFEKENRK